MVRSLALWCVLAWCACAAEPTKMAVGHDPAQVGEPVRLTAVVWTAIVSPHPITGTIDFTVDGVPIPGCTALPLTNLRASCESTFPRAGTYTLRGAYSGDAWWAPASDAALLSVDKFVPGVYLAFAPVAPMFGDKVTVGGRVLGTTGVPPPVGTLTFSETGRAIGTVPVDAAGHAEVSLPFGAGPHTILVTYSGDDHYRGGFQAAGTLIVAKASPVVAISSTPAQIDQPVAISASVTAPNPSGMVTFSPIAGCAGLPILDGKATCRTTFTQLGDVSVSANYSGDSNILPGSAVLKLKVGRVVAGLYLAFTPAAPVFGETVRVSALAMAAPGVGPPTGAILFSDGGLPIEAAPLGADARATIQTALGVGAHPIIAMYNGDVNYGSSQATTTPVVARASTNTTVTAITGGPFTAVVSPVWPGSGTPTGQVRFLRDGQVIGTVALVSMGRSSIASIDATSQTGAGISAEYSGDGNFTGSVSAPVLVSAPSVQITLTSDRNPAAEGQRPTFTATVTPSAGTAAPTGSVQFATRGSTLGSAVLTAGVASLSADLPAGSHTITATYSGDAVYPAASATLTQVVSAATETLSLSVTEKAPVFGQAITFTAVGSGSGMVQFLDAGAVLGSAALVSGVAQLTVATLTAGTHAVSASCGAASAQLTLTVSKAPSVTALVWSSGSAVATVRAAAGLPSGAVQFVNAATGGTIAAAPMVGGRASIPWQIGDSLIATYGGDENFLASSSAAVSPLTAANAASYSAESFAPDEMVALFGPNLGVATVVEVTDSAGIARKAEVLYATLEQAAIVMPSDAASGPAVLRVGAMSAQITITRTSPGVFSRDSSGTGAAAGTDAPSPDADSVVLYGTGIRHYAEKPTCTVEGHPVEVLYAGPQGGVSGLDQVNLLLPADLRGAGTVSVVLTVDGVAANAVTVIAPGSRPR